MGEKKDFTKSITLLLIAFFYGHLLYHGLSFAGSKNAHVVADIELPNVRSFVLDNRIRMFYIEDELPQLTIILSVGFGKLYENRNNAGISDLLVKTLLLAGSKKYPAQILHRRVERIGGSFSIHSSWEEILFTIQVLERDVNFAFDILADLILNPNLDAGFIEKAKSLLLEDVRRKKDNPDILAFEKLREIIFNGNGYGSVMRAETLEAISKKDIVKLWDKYFNAENMIIGISSSIDFKRIKNFAKNGFSNIRKGDRLSYDIDNKSISLSMREKAKRVYLVQKNIPQATIALGTIAPNVKDARLFPLRIMNYILGEASFNSRLIKEIRVRRGLSYAVQSVIRFRRNTGIFLAYSQTKNETTDLTLSLMLDNIRLMAKDPVSDEELNWTKDSIRNSYIFEFDTPLNVLNKYAFISYNELTESFLYEYIKNIDLVTKDMVFKSSKDLLKNGLIKVVVGKSKLKRKLEKFGKVIIVNP